MGMPSLPQNPDVGENEKYVPKWMKGFFYLGEAPALTARQWKVLVLIVVVTFFETYDIYLFILALKQIQVVVEISRLLLAEGYPRR